MFGKLKEKLKLGIKSLSEGESKELPKPPEIPKPPKREEPKPVIVKKKEPQKQAKKEEQREVIIKKEESRPEMVKEAEPDTKPPKEEKKSIIGRIRGKVTERELSEKDIDSFFEDNEMDFLQANVALEVVDFLKDSLKKRLVGEQIKRMQGEDSIRKAFEESLMEILDQGDVDLLKVSKKPYLIVFMGFNGSGKTTSIAKLGDYLLKKKKSVVLAAGDTFRAASIEQIQHHADRLGVKLVKHDYGADAAAVVFDAVKHAESKGIDFVIADTAGRMHTDKNLLDELRKVIRVNKPDLKVLVIDSLTGNDAVDQARMFEEAVGVDAVVLTKTDVNEKGGSILSVCYTIKKPILFLGTGQEYEKIKIFNPGEFVGELLG